jgi:hypothetical protein
MSSLVVLLAALPLALAACGGSDKSSDSSSSSSGTVAGATGSTGAAGSKGTTGTGGAKPGGSTGSNGTGGASANIGGSSSGSGSGGNSGKKQPAKKKPKKPQFLPGAFVGQKNLLYKQSKTVCHALTLDGLAHEYNVKPKTPEAVARRYAKAYPSSIRNAVYRGCKAGLS